MSKIKQALEKVDLLKNIDKEIKEIEHCNQQYKQMIYAFKNNPPTGIAFTSQKGTISMNFDMKYCENLFESLIAVNNKTIKSLKAKLIKLV